jgi:Cyclin
MRSFPSGQPTLYQYPPTPPEDFLPGFGKPNMAFHYHPQQFQHHMGMRPQDEHQDRFGRSMMPPMGGPPNMYPATTFLPAPSMTATAMPLNYYKRMPGPIHPPLPPMRVYDAAHHIPHAPAADHPQPRANGSRPQEVVEDRPVGGVSAKLDYEMETMTDFVAETAHSIITPNRAIPVNFRKWVHQVLSATRLPSATILLAFEYLASYMKIMQRRRPMETSETDLYHLLTTALILGSKFLDDNTFINKSWADVSGIDVAILNRMERDWLVKFDFRLHRDPTVPDAFHSFEARWIQYKTGITTVRHSPRATIPIEPPMSQQVYSPVTRTGFGEPSPPPGYSVKQNMPFHQQAYGRFDSFLPTASSTTSPPSAPHSGPTTPEYYGPQANWAVLPGGFGFSRLPPPAYGPAHPQQPMQQTSVSPGLPQGNPFPGAYAGPIYASGHGPECFCTACNRRYMMAPHFGLPQPVVG